MSELFGWWMYDRDQKDGIEDGFIQFTEKSPVDTEEEQIKRGGDCHGHIWNAFPLYQDVDTQELEKLKKEHAELLEALECMVIWFGKDDGYYGGLLPANAQVEEVAYAMKVIERVKGE